MDKLTPFKNVLHRIQVRLYPNRLPNATKPFIGRPVMNNVLDMQDVCVKAVEDFHLATDVDTMQKHAHDFLSLCFYLACDGYRIRTPYFEIQPRISGGFEAHEQTFDPKEHKVSISLRLTRAGRELVKLITLSMETAAVTDGIFQAEDLTTESINGRITPDGFLRLRGRRLKVQGQDAATGVRFAHIETGETFLVKEAKLVVNYPTELVLPIPPLPQGAYQVTVVSQYVNGTFPLKHPQEIGWDTPLYVDSVTHPNT